MKNDGLYNTLELGCNFLLFFGTLKSNRHQNVQDMIVLYYIRFNAKTVDY